MHEPHFAGLSTTKAFRSSMENTIYIVCWAMLLQTTFSEWNLEQQCPRTHVRNLKLFWVFACEHLINKKVNKTRQEIVAYDTITWLDARRNMCLAHGQVTDWLRVRKKCKVNFQGPPFVLKEIKARHRTVSHQLWSVWKCTGNLFGTTPGRK